MYRYLLRHSKRNWLWLLVNGSAAIVCLWTMWRLFSAPLAHGPATFSPGETRQIVLFSGKTALVLLVLSLACTPAASIFGWWRVITVRKSLGLWGFAFACLHMLFHLGNTALLSETRAWQQTAEALMQGWKLGFWVKVPYAWIGYYAFLLLIPLVLTSNRRAMKRMGKWWKRLHSLVYVIVPLVVWHYAWKVKLDNEWPLVDVTPARWGLAQAIFFVTGVALLLLYRIPQVRNAIKLRNGKRSKAVGSVGP